MKPAVVEDSRYLLVGPDPTLLSNVRLGATKLLRLVVIAPGADGALHVVAVLGTVLSAHPDARPAPNDQSADALAVLALHYVTQHGGQLPDGHTFALRVVPR